MADAPPATAPRSLASADVAALAPELAALLVDAVADGASVGYLAGLTQERATRYWCDLAAAVDGRTVIVAEDAHGPAGVVIVVPAPAEFQPHRADIAKLVVHRRARGRGLGAALLSAAEAAAHAMGRGVLTLTTRHGSEGEHLYRKRGWTLAGVIPQDSLKPDGTFADGAIWCKRLPARR